MTNEEFNREISFIEEDLMEAEDIITSCMRSLEEMKCKATARKLDTVSGKLYNVICELEGKRKTWKVV